MALNWVKKSFPFAHTSHQPQKQLLPPSPSPPQKKRKKFIFLFFLFFSKEDAKGRFEKLIFFSHPHKWTLKKSHRGF